MDVATNSVARCIPSIRLPGTCLSEQAGGFCMGHSTRTIDACVCLTCLELTSPEAEKCFIIVRI